MRLQPRQLPEVADLPPQSQRVHTERDVAYVSWATLDNFKVGSGSSTTYAHVCAAHNAVQASSSASSLLVELWAFFPREREPAAALDLQTVLPQSVGPAQSLRTPTKPVPTARFNFSPSATDSPTTPPRHSSASGWQHDPTDMTSPQNFKADTIYLTRTHLEVLFPAWKHGFSVTTVYPTVTLTLVPANHVPPCDRLVLQASHQDILVSGITDQTPKWLTSRLVRIGSVVDYQITKQFSLHFKVTAVNSTLSSQSVPRPTPNPHADALNPLVEIGYARTSATTAIQLSLMEPNATADPLCPWPVAAGTPMPSLGEFLSTLGAHASRLKQLWDVTYGAQSPFATNLPLTGHTTVLLTGSPGIGKTFVVCELARFYGAHVLTLDVGQLAQEFPGDMARGVFQYFDWATRHPTILPAERPVVMLLENLELFTPRGDAAAPLGLALKWALRPLQSPSALKASNCQPTLPIVVCATSSAPEAIDPDIRQLFVDDIELTMPTPAQRRRIFEYWLASHHPALKWPPLVTDQLVAQTHGYTPADIDRLGRNLEPLFSLPSTSSPHSPLSLDLPAPLVQGFCRQIQPSLLKAASQTSTDATASSSPPYCSGVQWADIGGLADAKQTLKETVVWYYQHIAAFRRLSIQPRRGLLLHGPPGTGKTLLARAVAAESHANFISISIPQLIKGEVKALFGRKDTGGQLGKNLISQFLLELDAIGDGHDRCQVVVLAATNHLTAIDPSILRPGRLDTLIPILPPAAVERKAILAIHGSRLHGVDTSTIDWDRLADNSAGLTGADLKGIVNKAGHHALSRAWQQVPKDIPNTVKEVCQRVVVTQADFDRALVEFGARIAGQ
ncbi:hypothetical protein H4R34_003800 [Dimargaris verticillata]|uniref:AAA+ ATPase domain-containing protein n=1 Tax=Dimargaris verticillata TaxID=2761393 RepID=A0A9W8EBP9_9FUNG|nr:hypothetical protein H4R34_003800 [Dimargaris verticillata]